MPGIIKEADEVAGEVADKSVPDALINPDRPPSIMRSRATAV
jgi:hypothetical protein